MNRFALRLRYAFGSISVIAGTIGIVACGDRAAATNNVSQGDTPDVNSDAAQMALGLELLNRNNPDRAADVFRGILKRNPTHNSARFQLAAALERAGKPAEARSVREVGFGAAEGSGDTATAPTAQTRPAQLDTVSQVGMINEGLNLLYARNDPGAAAEQFRKVLEKNPTHYGATYQLAIALDRTGKSAQARPYWEKVLVMAERNKDQATLNTAREKLRRR